MKHSRWSWALTLLLGFAPSLTAQQVRDRILIEGDSTPVPHALLLLLDESGQGRARSTTNQWWI